MKHLIFKNQVLELNGIPRIMGILNVTPDSFYDGGRYFDRSQARDQALRMADEGADILDIGGESTRPGAEVVSPEEEIQRVVPLIESLVGKISIPISIDTYKAQVARASLAAGAEMVNDISGLTFDPELVSVVAELGAPVVLMHTIGRPQVMQGNPVYRDLIKEIKEFLAGAIQKAERSGVKPENIIVDPGIGFGKTLEHNLEIINRLADFQDLGKPVMIGPSRKSFIGRILDEPAGERLEGTLAAVAIAAWNGAEILRVHDVRETRKVVRIVTAIKNVKSQ
ncbi:MAG: dihydropteroate synthase [Proteobacteria bacterium]|nr:dihydropteroate synthase [Pseudomonadota bacterium]